MGWLSWQNEKRTTDEVMRATFTYGTIHATSFKRNTWYAAYQPKGKPYTICLVVLIERKAGGFAYKDMDESMGPIECSPSRAVLAALTPLSQIPDPMSYAADWRARCGLRENGTLGAASVQAVLI